jgi:AraC-like DNA-binding protein
VLAETRIHLAASELTDTDKPVAEIAYDLGYADSSNFTRAFRRQIGTSPQAFRETAKDT